MKNRECVIFTNFQKKKNNFMLIKIIFTIFGVKIREIGLIFIISIILKIITLFQVPFESETASTESNPKL